MELVTGTPPATVSFNSCTANCVEGTEEKDTVCGEMGLGFVMRLRTWRANLATKVMRERWTRGRGGKDS